MSMTSLYLMHSGDEEQQQL